MQGHSRVTLGSRPGYYTLSSIAGGEGGSGGVPLLWQRGSGVGGSKVGNQGGGGVSHQRVSAAVRDASQGRGNTPPTHSELNQEGELQFTQDYTLSMNNSHRQVCRTSPGDNFFWILD